MISFGSPAPARGTGAPTAGTTDYDEMIWDAQADTVQGVTFNQNGEEPLTLRGTAQGVGFVTSGAATITGRIVWVEE